MYFDGYDGYGYRGASFEQRYQCFSASFIDKPHIETGDRIIMPPSALDRLASLQIDYPMLFELRNDDAERVSHCGVLEFVAEEGRIYMPYWMMENMLLQEGDLLHVKNVTLPKGTYVKLQPHTKDFLDISNPKAILETTLRNFSCLTTGGSIMVAYNNKKYYIDIVETKPSNAISIIETDCEVDFAPPLDYKEPEKPTAPIRGREQEAPAEEAEPKFSAFTGTGRRLDGKSSSHQSQPISSARSSEEKLSGAASRYGPSQQSAGSSSVNGTRQAQGKLVFGQNANQNPKGTSKEATMESKQEQPEKEVPKFQPFSGKRFCICKLEMERSPLNCLQYSILLTFELLGSEPILQRKTKMAMMQWCGAVARGVMAAERRSPSLTSSMAVEGLVPILCGRGDKKTKKGKIFKGSYGNARPKKEKKIQRIKDKIEVPSSTPWPLPFKLI